MNIVSLSIFQREMSILKHCFQSRMKNFESDALLSSSLVPFGIGYISSCLYHWYWYFPGRELSFWIAAEFMASVQDFKEVSHFTNSSLYGVF